MAVDETDPHIRLRTLEQQIRDNLEDAGANFIAVLMDGYPPGKLADRLIVQWQEFEAQYPDPGFLVPVWEHVFRPRIEAVRAWPHGAFAEAILAQDDELAALFRQRFLA